MRTSVRPWLVGVAAIPLVLALTGCFAGPNITGPDAGDAPVDDEMVEDLVEGSGGDVDFESGELPADFPVDDIPLVEGEVGPSFSVPGSDGKTAWQVTIVAPDEETANGAVELLVEAGFSNESVIGYEKDGYLVVIVGIVEAEGGWQVSYLVTQQ